MRGKTILTGTLLAIVGAGPVAAQLTLADMPFTPEATVTDAVYRCEGLLDDIYVSYVNDTFSNLAIVPVPGILDDPVPIIFANVIAASGARYAAGVYVWWTRGDEASLYDLRNGEDAPPITVCREVPAP